MFNIFDKINQKNIEKLTEIYENEENKKINSEFQKDFIISLKIEPQNNNDEFQEIQFFNLLSNFSSIFLNKEGSEKKKKN